MGKPRLIILVRHAQSEGNKNRDIHQMIPDHRVKLTDEGWHQAEEAGRRLRSMLRPDDSIQFFTSPYRRTRETTEGILRTLTQSRDDEPPSPFSRHAIKVYEEPRLREQDFGNFQPCSAEMERMWQERADYGHFFYRIPNGESAADAYDRVSGFNESLWRSFSEPDFPSVCVLVTHGLMSRVFLMKWYHWSVEYFEDLRNVNHCEMVLMEQNKENGKYVLQHQLRTWSELKKQRAEDAKASGRPASSSVTQASPAIQPRRWGGCVSGCNHDHSRYPRRNRRPTHDISLPEPAQKAPKIELETNPTASQQATPATTADSQHDAKPATANGTADPTHPKTMSDFGADQDHGPPLRPSIKHLNPGRDFGGSESGAATPADGLSDDESGYFGGAPSASGLPANAKFAPAPARLQGRSAMARALKRAPRRQPTEEDIERWASESGMGAGKRADALGDEPDEDEEEDAVHERTQEGQTAAATRGEDDAGLWRREEERDKSVRGSVY